MSPTKSSTKRKNLAFELNVQVRLTTANSVIFSKVIADRVGQHPTDLECLDFMQLHEHSTAGDLARLTGLTTGAITAVIDRLEHAGYVRRQRDEKDRRKVIVVPSVSRINSEIAPLTRSMGRSLDVLLNEFSEADLDTILRFLTKANVLAAKEIARLRGVERRSPPIR